jgi:cell division protein FtsZ
MEGIYMTADPAHDRIAAAIRAISALVTSPPNLVGFDFADLREALLNKGRAVFGEGEASGPDRAIKAADAALAEIRKQLRP